VSLFDWYPDLEVKGAAYFYNTFDCCVDPLSIEKVAYCNC
jgi:hypothetical protein